MTQSQPPLDMIQGVVERLTFHSDESGYTVARLKVPKEQAPVELWATLPQFNWVKRFGSMACGVTTRNLSRVTRRSQHFKKYTV